MSDAPGAAVASTELDAIETGPVLARGTTCEVVAGTWRGREVVIKRLISEIPEARERFAREVAVGRRVANVGGVVTVLAFGPSAEAPSWFVMPRLPGSLHDHLAAQTGAPGLGDADVTALARALARALSDVHGLGVVHRDLKPSNVLLDKDQQPLLADFGVAHVVESHTLTTPGTLIGTPIYMAPEQLRGGTVTAAADLYALGATLGEALTGVSPADPEALRTALRTRTGTLVDMLLACLEDDALRRPTATDLERRLAEHMPHANRRAVGFRVVAVFLAVVAAAAVATASWRLPRVAVTSNGTGHAAVDAPLREAVGRALRDADLMPTDGGGVAQVHLRTTPLGDGRVRHRVTIERNGALPVIVVGGDLNTVARRVGIAAAHAAHGGARPDDIVGAYLGEAQQAIALHAWDDAEAALQKARRLDITDPWPLLLLATVTWWAGEEVEARLWLDSARASDLAPADRGYVDGLAAMLDERFDDAAIAFAATQATTGETAELLYGAFEAHFHGGRVDDAVAAARRLRAIDPGNILPKSHLVDIAAENDDDGFAAFVESAMALTPMERALLGARRLARAGDIAGARALIDAAPRGTPELDVYLDTARCALRAFDARDTSDCRTPIMGDVLVPYFGDTRAIAARAIAVAERAPPFERPRVYELIAAQLPEVGDVDAQRLADAIVALDEGGRRHCPLAVARFTSLAVSSPFAAAYRSLFAAHPTPEDDERVRGLFAGAHATPGATSEVLIALLHAERIAAAGGDPAATCSRVLFSSTLTLPLVSLAPRCAALVASRGTASPALRERLTRWRAER